MCPPCVEGTEQFQTAKLHGVVFQSNFYFTAHVDTCEDCVVNSISVEAVMWSGSVQCRLAICVLFLEALALNYIVYTIHAWDLFSV